MQISHQTPLRAGKGSYFEGGIRVPLIVCWPGMVDPDSTCPEPVSNIDFMPTIAEIANVAIPEGKQVDGVSLSELLQDSNAKLEQRSLFWHFPIYLQASGKSKGPSATHDPWFRTRPGSVVRSGNWKLHEYFEDGRLELYDLKSDIGERTNVAAQHPGVAQRLHAELKNWRAQTSAPVPTELNPKYKPDSRGR